jgi:Spy/CpxP family protein refolding chaperone
VSHRSARWTLAFVALLLIAGHAGAGAADEPGRGEVNFSRELDLSEQQSARLTALHARIEAEDRQLQRRLKDRREKLEGLYSQYDLDGRQTRQVRKEIRHIQEQLLQLHERFQVELRQILTRSQFERLQQELHEREERERRRERRRRERDD